MRRCASSPPRSRARSSICACIRNCPISRRSRPRSGRSCKDGSVRIEQTIYVERESQRKIVLGKGGQTIKAIGAAARREIAAAIEQPVHLFLFVKVREGWGDDPERYREMGLEFPEGVMSGPRRRQNCMPSSRDSCAGIAGMRRYNRRHPMQWTDEGIVLGVKRHGEASAILELMTREHGRHLGLVRGGAGTRLRAVLQPGNRCARPGGRGSTSISAITRWRARPARGRLPRGRARRLWRHASGGFVPPAARARSASRDPRRARRRSSTASSIRSSPAPLIARFELAFLAELGFGLDLASCAATGRRPIWSMCRRDPAARSRARPAKPGATSSCGFPASCARSRAGLRLRRLRRRRSCRCLRADRIFLDRHAFRAARPRPAGRARALRRGGERLRMIRRPPPEH